MRLIALMTICCCLSTCARAEATNQQSVADLVSKICKDPKKLHAGLSSVSTMLQLIDYFEDELPSNSACRKRYLSSFRFMLVVLSVENEDVCSEDKVSLLEDFNRRFLSTTYRDVSNQKQDDLEAPAVVGMFFMHYAHKISSICKGSLLAELESTSFQFLNKDGKPADMDKVDEILNGFQINFGLNPAKNGYKDLIIPWNLIDAFHQPESGNKHTNEVNTHDGRFSTLMPVRISIRAAGADRLKMINRACADHLKPVYSRLALPVIRMINLGLYEDNEPFAEQMASNKDLNRLFGLTQICETILPIEAFQDDSLKDGKIVVISAEKAAELRAQQLALQTNSSGSKMQASVGLERAGENQSLVDLDEIDSLTDFQEAKRLADAIRVNRVNQEKVALRMIEFGKSLIKSQVKIGNGEFLSLTSPLDGDLDTQLEIQQSAGATRKKRAPVLPVVVLIAALLVFFRPVFIAVVRWILSKIIWMIAFPFYIMIYFIHKAITG